MELLLTILLSISGIGNVWFGFELNDRNGQIEKLSHKNEKLTKNINMLNAEILALKTPAETFKDAINGMQRLNVLELGIIYKYTCAQGADENCSVRVLQNYCSNVEIGKEVGTQSHLFTSTGNLEKNNCLQVEDGVEIATDSDNVPTVSHDCWFGSFGCNEISVRNIQWAERVLFVLDFKDDGLWKIEQKNEQLIFHAPEIEALGNGIIYPDLMNAWVSGGDVDTEALESIVGQIKDIPSISLARINQGMKDEAIVKVLAEKSREQVKEFLTKLYQRFNNNKAIDIAVMFPHEPEHFLHQHYTDNRRANLGIE